MPPAAEAAEAGADASRRAAWRPSPLWRWHLAFVPAAVGLLWSYSVPGLAVFMWSVCALALAAGAVVWVAGLVVHVRARRRGSDARGRWLLVAPAAGALVVALIVTSAPLQARWALSRSSFEATAAEAMKDGPLSPAEQSPVRTGRGWIGLYNVPIIHRQGEAVIFHERTGLLFDDAGFAFLPNGPFAELESGDFERPEFRHLGGPWYAWTASW